MAIILRVLVLVNSPELLVWENLDNCLIALYPAKEFLPHRSAWLYWRGADDGSDVRS